MDFRPHRPADYDAIIALRWLLKSEDEPLDPAGYERFAEAYRQHLAKADRQGDTTHWLAEQDGDVIGAMTLRKVAKEPAPDGSPGAIGYLTNCCVASGHRGKGVGTALLDALATAARADGLELLIVWPSERAYPFYRRAGFKGDSDPLELLL